MNLRVPPDDDKLELIDNFAVFLKIAFIQTLVSSAVESSIRSVTLSVNEKDYRKVEYSFKRVYHLLLSEVYLLQHEPLLDLLRCIRNANHDNGIYYGKNENIEHKGSHYSFINEGRIVFLTWDILLDFTSDLKDLIRDLVNSNKVNSPEKIEDFSVL